MSSLSALSAPVRDESRRAPMRGVQVTRKAYGAAKRSLRALNCRAFLTIKSLEESGLSEERF